MSDLSPQAWAVLDAAYKAPDDKNATRQSIAAALRALAEHCECDDGEGYWIYRPNILAIADELETQESPTLK